MADLRTVIFTDRDGDVLSAVPRDPDHPGPDPVISITRGTTTLSVVMTDDDFDQVVLALNDLRLKGRGRFEAEPTGTEGWAPPTAGSRKWHYYDLDRRSLCGKYVRLFASNSIFEPDNGPSLQDCAGCRKALDKRKAKADG